MDVGDGWKEGGKTEDLNRRVSSYAKNSLSGLAESEVKCLAIKETNLEKSLVKREETGTKYKSAAFEGESVSQQSGAEM